MEFKGTKGEWKYEVKYGKGTPRITVQIPIRQNYNQELILGRISEDECTVNSCCCIEEHSNAKLIASAPEMFEQLKRLREAILSEDYIRMLAESQLSKELLNKITE